jgi:DNA-binding MarR family transcriptional regulator
MTHAVDDRLLALFFLAWRGFAAEADRLLETAGLGRVHHRVLYSVARTPGISVGELASSLGISRQALHRSLSELLARGFISSRVAEASRRERALQLTPQGKRIEQRASSAQAQLLGQAFAEQGKSAEVGWIKIMRALAEPIARDAPSSLADKISAGLAELADGDSEQRTGSRKTRGK